MKKIIIIISGLILLGLVFFTLKNSNVLLNAVRPSSTPPTPTPTVSGSTEGEIAELEFTPEQLEGYYKVYSNPFVLHVRKALNGYLDGTNDGILSPETAIKAQTLEGAFPGNGIENAKSTPAGLDSFSKDYYRSKFIVMAIDDGITGGKIINIIFQDKPDKLFNAWVYKGEDFELRGFWQNMNFTSEEMRKTVIQYKRFIEDKEHAL